MAPGSCFCRNAPPRSAGHSDLDELGSPPNKGPPHQTMHVVQSPPRLPPSIQRKLSRQSRSSVWIHSSRRKTVDRKASEKCKDHFDTAGAFGTNRTPFAASFLCSRISFRWHQYKRRQGKGVAPLPWVKFKAFFRKSLGDSSAFVDTIWNRVKQNSQYQQEEIQDWASHLISNPSLSSLMLTGLQKSPVSFGSSEKGSSLWLRPRWNNAGGS